MEQLERGLAGWQVAIPEELARIRRAEREAELASLAQTLAAHLQNGEPCPVCGGTDHPGIAGQHKPAETAGETGEEAARLERLGQEARERQMACRQLMHALQAMEQQADQAAERAVEAKRPAQPDAYKEAAAAAVVEIPSWRSASMAEGLKQVHEHLSEGERQAQALQQSMQKLLQDKRQMDKQLQELNARRQALETLMSAQEQVSAETKRSLNEIQSGWTARFPDLQPDQVVGAAETLRKKDEAAEDLRERLEKSVAFLTEKQTRLEQLQAELSETDKLFVKCNAEQQALEQLTAQKQKQLEAWVQDQDAAALAAEVQTKLMHLRHQAEATAQQLDGAQAASHKQAQTEAAARQAAESTEQLCSDMQQEWGEQSAAEGFKTAEEVSQSLLAPEQQSAWQAEVEAHTKLEHQLTARRVELSTQLGDREVTDEAWLELENELKQCKEQDEAALQTVAKAERDWEDLQEKHARWSELEMQRAARQQQLGLLGKLQTVLRGNAFVEFLSEEQLMHVSRTASERLGQLTRQKYAIEVDSSGGFVIRDDANGGVRRPVTTLSGGETFLTSLSLALALSAQIQLKGQYPLEFFFLDEGFGTLDQDLLEAVITALEKLHLDKLTVGVISHVPELRARLPRRLVVHPAEPGGRGSRIALETM
ncbi:SbcC/MukB-like Walker B domain-containing protein [Paenibacillus cremeus]|uniref:Nuclease SbcCD subunit C n=2 Tax=Paenibacillus cremeus TaxID=2163881 RepID=A0A559JC52_9BACL|nr:DNA exonuclease [Paenibacillus cremeus]